MCKNKYKNLICIFVRSKNLDCKFLNYINSFHTFSSIVSSNLRCVLFCNCICSTMDIRSYDKSSFHFQFTSISCSKLSNFFFLFCSLSKFENSGAYTWRCFVRWDRRVFYRGKRGRFN